MNKSPPASERSNLVRLWREADFGGAELLAASYHNHHFPPHAHDEYAFGIIERGAQAFQHDRGKRLTMPQGSIGVINPGDVHEGRPTDGQGWDYRMVYLSPDFVCRLFEREAGHPAGLPWFARNVIFDDQTIVMLRAAHCSSASPHASRLEVSSLLTAAVIQLFARHAQFRQRRLEQAAAPRAVRHAREFIDAHLVASPSLEELASVAGVSPYHLLRQFKAIHGMAPHRYLIQRRVAMAKTMLLAGRQPRRVAIELGYCDQAHLSREFKTFYGVAPSRIGR